MNTSPPTAPGSSKAGRRVLFRSAEDVDASLTYGVILDVPQRKAVFAGHCRNGDALISDDGRYAVLVSLCGGDRAVQDSRLAVVDLQSMILRLSWDTFADLQLVKLNESILRVMDARSAERSFPLDIRSMPWGYKRKLDWVDWPLKEGEEQTAVLTAMRGAAESWEENPAFARNISKAG